MSVFQLLLILFLVIPFIEIYLLIEIGGVIGSVWTIFLVVFTAVLGAFFVRQQGISTMHRLQSSIQAGGMPAVELLEGAALLLAGALLLTPGFFTDAIGFAILIPPMRQAFIKFALLRFVHPPSSTPQDKYSRTIEGEYNRLDD